MPSATPSLQQGGISSGTKSFATHKDIRRQDLFQLLGRLGILNLSWIWDQQTLPCTGSSNEWVLETGPHRCPLDDPVTFP